MFSKGNKPKQEAPPPSAARKVPPSILAEDLELVGNIESVGDIQLDGRLRGDVTSIKLTVGESAVITGTIYGEEVRIAGTVNGEITARKVELTSTARVTGDINHDSLSVQAGAYVQGLCKRVDIDKLKAKPMDAAGGDAETKVIATADPSEETKRPQTAG